MRDSLMFLAAFGALPFALMHTWVGVMLWNWVSLMNPHKLAWGPAFNFPFAAVIGGVTLLSLLLTRDRLKLPLTAPVMLIITMMIWMCITTALAISPGESWPQLFKVLKIQLMILVSLAALHSRRHVEFYVWVAVISIGFFGFKGGLFTLQTGGGSRVWGPPGGFIEDNNALATALVMIIPLMNYLREVATRPFIRRGLLLLMLLCAVSVLGSQSRGALLAITAMGLVFWFRSHRMIVSGAVLIAVAVGLVTFMPQQWGDRMGTIATYEEDSSAMGRIGAWNFTTNVATARATGGGFGVYTVENYAKYSEVDLPPQAAHSIYFSMLGEHGFVGLALFLALWAFALRLTARLRKMTQEREEVAWVYRLASMCQVALVGYLVGGAFLSLAYFDLAFNIVVILVVLERWVLARGWEVESSGPFGSGAPRFRRSAKPGRAPMARTR